MVPLLRRYWPGWEIVRFAIIGILATLTHYLVLTTLVEIAGLAPTPANGAAFCAAVGVTYTGQALWVFKVQAHSFAQVQKFMVTAIGGFLANVGLMALLEGVLELNYQIAFVIILLIVPLATYFANKFWVFTHTVAKNKETKHANPDC